VSKTIDEALRLAKDFAFLCEKEFPSNAAGQHMTNYVETHFSCLTDYRHEENIEHCGREFQESVQQCTPEPLMSCAEPVILQSESCDSGAFNLIQDVRNRVLSALPHCSGKTKGQLFRRMMSNF